MKQRRHRSTVLARLLYRLGLNAGVPFASLALRRPALRQGHQGRLAAPARLEEWAREHRDPNRPLAWFHAASVGEGLQARAVLEWFRKSCPEYQVVATRFSASAERLSSTMPADHNGYVPYDRRRDVARALTALRPDLLVFAKLDVWPELATAAAALGTRVALVAGSVDPGSARLGWFARALARRGYGVLQVAGAISAEDAERLVLLGVERERITVTGDPRVDAVLETVEDALHEGGGSMEPSDADLLVAGSTWPDDEAMLLTALVAVRRDFPAARMMIVPHEPTPDHVASLEARSRALGLSVARWTGTEDPETAVTIVDRMGVLSALYARGAVAYVGGGFGERGIHSVLEPAGWHRPVLIGPNDRGVRDARLLGLAGGLFRLPARDPASALTTQWCGWLEHPSAREIAGRRAGDALAADRGAAHRSAELLATLRYP